MSESGAADERSPHLGTEPDYRFSLANERTFLAYVRTSLAFFGGGAAILSFFDDVVHIRWLVVVVGLGLYVLGLFTAGMCYFRWRNLERAMRRGEPLPHSIVPVVITVAVMVLAVIALVGVLLN